MTETLADPTVRLYAICASLLVLKMAFTGHATAVLRNVKGVYISAEDYALRGREPGPPDERIERLRRAHRNDLEEILPFLTIGLLFALSGPSPGLAWWLFVGFTAARILHTIVYAAGLQPWRSIVFGVGDIILVVMTVLLLVNLSTRST